MLDLGVEWFCSYGKHAVQVHDIFVEVYLKDLKEKNEIEAESDVLLTPWISSKENTPLQKAIENFDLMNQDRSLKRMDVCVILE